MKRFSTLMAVVMLMAFWSGAALAGEPAADSAAKKSAAAERLNSPRTTTGEVMEMTPGKSVQIKEETGKVHNYGLTKSTKIDGDLQVGTMITVVSTGRWAREIAVQPEKSEKINPLGPQAKN